MANEGFLGDLLGYKTVVVDANDQLVELPRRDRLYLTGDGVDVQDDVATRSTKVTIAAPSGGGGGGGTTAARGVLDPVRVAFDAPATLAGLYETQGVILQDGDRVLVAGNDPAENRIYLVRDLAWEPAADELVGGALVVAQEGDFADVPFVLTANDPIVVGVSPLAWERIGGGDATSLRGVALHETVGVATPSSVLVAQVVDGETRYVARKLANAEISQTAAIHPSKLAPGANGQILRTVDGAPAWGTLSAGDVGMTFVATAPPAGDVDNFSPAGWSTAGFVWINPTQGVVRLRGLGPAAVKRKTLQNPYGSGVDVVLVSDAPGQGTYNQLRVPDGGELRLRPGETVDVVSDDFAWYVLGATRGRGFVRKTVPLGRLQPFGMTAWDDWKLVDATAEGVGAGLLWVRSAGGTGGLVVPIELPSGTRLIAARMFVQTGTNILATVADYRSAPDRAAPFSATETQLGIYADYAGGNGKPVEAAHAATTIDNDAYSYYARITAAAGTWVRVYSVDLEVDERTSRT